jgi:hypothetical protein
MVASRWQALDHELTAASRARRQLASLSRSRCAWTVHGADR